ncbi:RDD family protein [Pseudonocardia sp. MCCB 268]|nr:RDD family protein [Pseudonocardia cytotoxica]
MSGARRRGRAAATFQASWAARWIESWLRFTLTDPATTPPGTLAWFGLPASGHYWWPVGAGSRASASDWLLAYLLVVLVAGTDAIAPPTSAGGCSGPGSFSPCSTVAVLVALALALGMRVARTDMAEQVGVPRAPLRRR